MQRSEMKFLLDNYADHNRNLTLTISSDFIQPDHCSKSPTETARKAPLIFKSKNGIGLSGPVSKEYNAQP